MKNLKHHGLASSGAMAAPVPESVRPGEEVQHLLDYYGLLKTFANFGPMMAILPEPYMSQFKDKFLALRAYLLNRGVIHE